MKRIIFLLVLLINHSMLFAAAKDHIFKEYDIRGIVGEEFEIADAYEIGRAIATYFRENDPELTSIYVGADGRVHSPAIKKEIVQSLRDHGFNVISIGTCTTPTVYYALHTTESHPAGLMITASHNPGEYNGIKICLGKNLISGNEIKKVLEIYKTKSFDELAAQAGGLKEVDMIERYIDCLAELFPHLIGADFKAIFDCGNGAAGTVLPRLLQKMQWHQVKLLYAEVDGTYPHHIADPTVEKYMADLKALLAFSNEDFGLGFDGDCDRMAAMTKDGKLIKGDQLLGLYSKLVLENYPGSSIVFDVSSSKALFDLIKKRGGVPVIAQTGVANVKKKMAETGAMVGGEMSCHTIFKDRYFGFDDGIYSMMRLLELLQKDTLEQLLSEYPAAFSSPTYRLPCERTLCFTIIDALKEKIKERTDIELITVDGLRVHFPYGWAIVRPSNTEPLISIRFEGNTPEDLVRIKKEFHEVISQYMECEIFLN